MSTFQEYHVRNKLFLISMENLAMKTHPFTLVLHGPFWLFLCLGQFRDRIVRYRAPLSYS